MKEVLIEILKNNPGFATVAITTIFSTVTLPIAILIITGRQGRKSEKQKADLELEKAKFVKKLEDEFEIKGDQRIHEKIIHSSLVKILFEVQKLHIALSGNCVDFKCIDEAVGNFKNAFSKYQDIISDNQIFLSSKDTNNLYAFYKLLGELLIELKEIQEKSEFDVAIVSVYTHSQLLADTIVEIQESFLGRRQELQSSFDKADLSNFRDCCGRKPDVNRITKYNEIKAKMDELPDAIVTPIQKN